MIYLGGGSIGAADLKKKLQMEKDDGLTNKQKLQKERGKKTAEARAADSLRLEKVRQAKEKIKQSVKDWEESLKKREGGKRGDDDDDEADDDEDDMLDKDERKKQALKRIEELEILNEQLPSMEVLLVNKELNKEWFEKKLPLMLNHELLDDDKRDEIVMLVRKYQTLQTHVGYGVK